MIITINMLQDNKSWAKVIDQTDVLHTIYDRNTERERERERTHYLYEIKF